MPWIDEEQIAEARHVDLLTYLQEREPHELVSSAPGEYRTVSHGSLVISNGAWYWNRGGFGGVSALDYLVKVQGLGLVEAVEQVSGIRAPSCSSSLLVERQQPQPRRWKFYPPKPLRYANRAVSYLQRRGISPEVINHALQLGIFYESRYYNPKSLYHNALVCVFAGKDGSGKDVFAALRGIHTDLKTDKAGSDKRYNFHIPAKSPASRHLAVFESPIDALSHATLQQQKGWAWDGHRLSLGGTSAVALFAFLERNPQIKRVILHLDSDAAGQIAARKIKNRMAEDKRFRRIRVSINPARHGKDYNETLLHTIEENREQTGRHKEAGFSI